MTVANARSRGRRGPAAWAHLLAVAVQFLTRLPVPARFEPGDLRRASGAFPLVGAFVAAIGVGVRWSLDGVVGPALATVLSLGTMVLVTGALHEDGLADAVDGLWGGHTPDDRLRIMRDPRLGTLGTLALILVFAAKVAALAPMTSTTYATTLVPAMVLARASSLVLMRLLPPAPGSLASLAGPPTRAGGVIAVVTVVASLAGFAEMAWVPAVAAGGVIAAWRSLVRRRVGGVNGDLLGAANQLVEVAVLVAGAAVFHR